MAIKDLLEFWDLLTYGERKNVLTIPAKAVLSSLKEKSKHMCSCDKCGINQEVERLFDQFCGVLRFQAKHANFHDSDEEEIETPPALEDADSQYSSSSTITITDEEWFEHVSLAYYEPNCMTPESFERYEFGVNIVIDKDLDYVSVSDAWLWKNGDNAVRLLKHVELLEQGRMKRTFDELFTSIVNMNMHGRQMKPKRKRPYIPYKKLPKCTLRKRTQNMSREGQVSPHSSNDIVDENSSIETDQEGFEDDIDGDRYSDDSYYSEDSNSVISGTNELDMDERIPHDEFVKQTFLDEDEEEIKWRETLKLFRMYTAKLLYERIVLAFREQLAIQMQQELIKEEEKEERLAREKKERRQQKKKNDTKRKPVKKQKAAEEDNSKKLLEKKLQEEHQRKVLEEQQQRIELERKKVEEQMLEEIARQHLEQQQKLQEESKRQLEIEAEEEIKKREQVKSKKTKKRKKKKSKKKNLEIQSVNVNAATPIPSFQYIKSTTYSQPHPNNNLWLQNQQQGVQHFKSYPNYPNYYGQQVPYEHGMPHGGVMHGNLSQQGSGLQSKVYEQHSQIVPSLHQFGLGQMTPQSQYHGNSLHLNTSPLESQNVLPPMSFQPNTSPNLLDGTPTYSFANHLNQNSISSNVHQNGKQSSMQNGMKSGAQTSTGSSVNNGMQSNVHNKLQSGLQTSLENGVQNGPISNETHNPSSMTSSRFSWYNSIFSGDQSQLFSNNSQQPTSTNQRSVPFGSETMIGHNPSPSPSFGFETDKRSGYGLETPSSLLFRGLLNDTGDDESNSSVLPFGGLSFGGLTSSSSDLWTSTQTQGQGWDSTNGLFNSNKQL